MTHPIRTLLVTYGVSRLLALAAMWVAARWFQTPAGVGHLNPTVADILGLWDAQWYQQIAERGYPNPLPTDADTGRITYSAWAFFPLFPLLARGLMALGIPFIAAGVVINVVLGAIGTLLVWQICRMATHASPQAHRDRLALVAAALWCLYPATGILLMPYSEAVALVLIAGALLALLRRQYLLVAAAALLLGFTRAVAPALGVAVLAHVGARWWEERGTASGPFARDRWRVAVMVSAIAMSAVAWPATVALVTGRATAFFDVQAAWGQRPDKGPFVLWLSWAWDQGGPFAVVLMVACVAAYVALIAGRHGRWLPLEVRAWAFAYPLYLFAVVRPITSMWRFLLLDFPIAALVASVAMRTSTGGKVVPHWRRRVALLVLPLVGGMFWWTATLLTFIPWGATPP